VLRHTSPPLPQKQKNKTTSPRQKFAFPFFPLSFYSV
jgi:hypothetical protein